MIRLITAVITGYAVWSIVWLIGGLSLMAAFGVEPGAQTIDDPAYLALALVLSVACSLLGGFVCGAIVRDGTAACLILGTALLLTGIAVQASAWDAMPLWYHLPFVALLEPMTMLGYWFAYRKKAATRSGALRGAPTPADPPAAH
jgi:hypothetical protein